MSTTTMTTQTRSRPSLTAPTARVFLLLGFAVWFVATVAFRLVGQYLLDPSAPLIVAGLFVVVVPAMIGLAILLYRWRGVTETAQVQAAIALVVPGMVLDAFAVAWFETVFPNMAPGAAKYFGGMLLLAYASVLLSGFIPYQGRKAAK